MKLLNFFEYCIFAIVGCIAGAMVWLWIIFFPWLMCFREPIPTDYGVWQPMTCRQFINHERSPRSGWECLPPVDQQP